MAEPEVKSLNIDAALTKRPKNRVARVGIELEGAWKTLPPGIDELEVDASVFKEKRTGNFHYGELPIGPMLVGSIKRQMTKYYPTKVDQTCGLHVHMAFQTIYQYSLLADSEAYQETVLEYLKRWGEEEKLPTTHPLWSRLKGDSDYCQKKFWPYEQMIVKRKDWDKTRIGHRYTMIHYCWGRYQTVECRLLPMMDTVEQGISVVKRLIDITNAYLLSADKHRVSAEGDLNIDSGDIYEEFVEVKL